MATRDEMSVLVDSLRGRSDGHTRCAKVSLGWGAAAKTAMPNWLLPDGSMPVGAAAVDCSAEQNCRVLATTSGKLTAPDMTTSSLTPIKLSAHAGAYPSSSSWCLRAL